MKYRFLFLFLSIHLFLAGCSQKRQRKVIPAFYYWKTVFDLDSATQMQLSANGIKRIYLRYFDVVTDKIIRSAVPAGDIHFATRPQRGLSVIPVVYVANEALLHTPDSLCHKLALNLWSRISETGKPVSLPAPAEIQIDCDWSPETREKYFNILRDLQLLCGKACLLSVTVRLHQLKYAEKTGIPPVARGMLMFYNMGKLSDPETQNSIYDPQLAARYLSGFNSYPLPLDVALPWFSWAVVMENHHVTHLVSDISEADLDQAEFRKTGEGHFTVLRGCKLRNVYLFQGETVRIENADSRLCDKAAKQIAPYLDSPEIHVAVFHFKKNQYTEYEKKVFEGVFHRFD